jgi:8-oxo-dGTP pyrophosphatase MutT (NUDIX family)
MAQRKMYNFPIEIGGNVYWRSRSVAVVGFIFCKDEDGYWNVLVQKRGPGAPNYRGRWCVCCGYLDFDEDGQQAIARETHEECGVDLSPEQFTFDSVFFETELEQNVCLRYTCLLNGSRCTTDFKLSSAYNEKNETEDIRWIRLGDVNKYDFAFGHTELIPYMAKKLGILK